MELTGASALVTGGASGLGLAAARRLAAAGARVVLLDLPGNAGVALAADGLVFAPGDVRETSDVQAALELAADLGPLRVLVNAAGVAAGGRVLSRSGPLPLAEFTRILDVNLVGTFNVTRLAAERMSTLPLVAEERGVVVNTASISAFDGQIGHAAYAASKAGVVGMTLPLARDLASSRIRVVTIAPGMFRTPMFAQLGEQAQADLAAAVPHPSRLGHPDEFGALVEHVVSNPMLNGEVIRLDGALRLEPRLV